MNILPHKSWHVRTKKNIERVRRDEEKAAEEEKEKQRRIALAEQEARTDLLRSRAHQKALAQGLESNHQATQALVPSASKDVDLPGLDGKGGHINFFKDIEDGLKKQGRNKDHEAEKKKEQEDLEKKIGLLTYLGQTALDEKESAPWYLQKKSRHKKSKKERWDSSSDSDEKESKIRMAKEHKHMSLLDPLEEMRQYVDKKKHKHKKHKKEKERKGTAEEKYKKERKSLSSAATSTPTPSSSSSSSSSGKKTIEQLRAERLARETKEKARVQALMKTTSGSGVQKSDSRGRRKSDSDSDEEEEEDRERKGGKRKYNSQYNPEFVRHPKERRTDSRRF